jgi:hypothetical protein
VISHLVFATLALSVSASKPDPLDTLAEGYVKLVLAVGRHAPAYVDAYFGPRAWQEEAERAGKLPLTELVAQAERLSGAARAVAPDRTDPAHLLRQDFLVGQLAALEAYLHILLGARFSFDEEARALYGVSPPPCDLRSFEAVETRLEGMLPGAGPLIARYQTWKNRLALPKDRIEPVMRAALEEVRRRTLLHVELPAEEHFSLALVTGKPWGAYNWYRGRAESLIEINTDLPVYIFNVVSLVAHEGYPGHHVFNALQEANLALARHEVEHTVYPLNSPISLVAEGSAEAGVDLVMPEPDRLAFERDVLFPLAGLDPAEAPRAASIRGLLKVLRGARSELARRYLDGRMTAVEVKDWLGSFGLATPEEAGKAVQFIDAYRSYIVNYSYGEDLVNSWLAARAGPDRTARWAAFRDLLASPRLPAALRSESTEERR